MWPDRVSNLGPLALESDVGEGYDHILTDQVGGSGDGGEGGWLEVD